MKWKEKKNNKKWNVGFDFKQLVASGFSAFFYRFQVYRFDFWRLDLLLIL